MVAFLLIMFSPIFGFNTINVCEIGNITYETSLCNGDGNYNVFFNFNHENTSDSFKIILANNILGKYAYADLPVSVSGIPGNGVTQVFHFQDLDHPDCSAAKEVHGPDCGTGGECDISNVSYNLSDCNNEGNYWIYFNFTHQNTSDSFKIYSGNTYYGTFAYANLPVTVTGIPGNGQAHNFIFKDKANPGCAADKNVPGVTCSGNEECDLSELYIMKLECNNDGQFNVKIDFDYVGTGATFKVQGNGNQYGTFNYSDLPIIIGPLNGNVNTSYEFVVKDITNPDCNISGFISAPYCQNGECDISNITFERTDCNNEGNYWIHFNFDHQNTSDSFYVFSANTLLGTYAYSNLPITIYGIAGNGQGHGFLFKDKANTGCAEDIFVPGKTCSGSGECHMSDLSIVKLECNNDGQFNVKINFNHENTSAHFTVQGNGHQYGTFSYNGLPIILGPFNGNVNDTYEFVIKDSDHPDCNISGFITGPYCENEECHINSVSYETTECDSSGHVNVFFNLEYQNTSDSFKVYQANVYIGTYAYSDLPVSFGPYEGNGQTMVFSFKDLLHPNCAKAKEVHAPNCNEENCHIFDISYNLGDCNGEGYYKIYLNFQHENTSNQFKLYVDNVYKGTYTYASLPIQAGPFLGNGQAHTYLVKDAENGDCRAVREIHGPQCFEENNCEIGAVSASISNCDEDGNFYVEINFEYSNTSDSFKIQGNGHNYDFFAYSDLPVVLGPFNGLSEMSYEFGIKDKQHPDCHAGTFITPPYCENGFDDPVMQISISNIICIDSDRYYADLDINHEVTGDISLNLWEENNLIGEYMSNSFPRQVILKTDVQPRVKINETDAPGNFAVKAYTHPDCLLATDKFDEQNLQVFPNPTSNDLTLNWKEVSYVYQLFDVNSKLVLKGQGSDKTQLQTANLQPGVYFIQISTGKQIIVRKVMKI